MSDATTLVVDPAGLPRFAADLPAQLAPERQAQLTARARALGPWLQGPFYLGGDLVVGGPWRNDERWQWIESAQMVGDLAGRSVLDVGCNAGYDPFMFRLRGAGHVVGCEPHEFIRQARFLEEVYDSGVDFRPIAWQALDPAEHGRYHLVHCHGLLYHETDPLALLRRLRAMTSDGGELLLGSVMLARPDASEYMRFVPDAFDGDGTWWWVPGRLALRWMLESAGFGDVEDLGVRPGPQGEFPVVTGYFRAS